MEEISQQAKENSSIWLVMSDNFISNETSFNQSDADQRTHDDSQSDSGERVIWKDSR